VSETVFYDSTQLQSAWQLLPGGPVAANGGECWQYLGSRLEDGTAEHQFRHRLHPAQGCRVYAYVLENDEGVKLSELRVKE